MKGKKIFGMMCILIVILTTMPINANSDEESIKIAFEYAEEELLPRDGVAGVGYDEGFNKIIIYIESEDYRYVIPNEIKGFETEVKISGRFEALDLIQEYTESEEDLNAIRLTIEELNEIYTSVEELKLEDANYYNVSMQALHDAVTFTDDGNVVMDLELVEDRLKSYFETDIEEQPHQSICGYYNRRGVVRPLMGGVSCSPPAWIWGGFMAGTLGIVTKKGYILSNAHVIALSKLNAWLPIGTAVIQPGSIDGGTVLNTVGRLIKYVRIQWYSYNYVDAAVAIATEFYFPEVVLNQNDVPGYMVNLNDRITPSIGTTVRKSGRTTGVTTNSIIDTSATVRVWYDSKYAYFRDQILVNQPFIDHGDSGSVVDYNGKWVGLVFAGSSQYAVVCKASRVVNELGSRYF